MALGATAASHNELERAKGYSPYQWTVGLSRPIWDPQDDALQNRSAHPNTDDLNLALNQRQAAAR
eukprot:4696493-Lingulodinium_polyedra.AAC.1